MSPIFRGHFGNALGSILMKMLAVISSGLRCMGAINRKDYPKKLNNMPAATAEPITPATLGAIACIRR